MNPRKQGGEWFGCPPLEFKFSERVRFYQQPLPPSPPEPERSGGSPAFLFLILVFGVLTATGTVLYQTGVINADWLTSVTQSWQTSRTTEPIAPASSSAPSPTDEEPDRTPLAEQEATLSSSVAHGMTVPIEEAQKDGDATWGEGAPALSAPPQTTAGQAAGQAEVQTSFSAPANEPVVAVSAAPAPSVILPEPPAPTRLKTTPIEELTARVPALQGQGGQETRTATTPPSAPAPSAAPYDGPMYHVIASSTPDPAESQRRLRRLRGRFPRAQPLPSTPGSAYRISVAQSANREAALDSLIKYRALLGESLWLLRQ